MTVKKTDVINVLRNAGLRVSDTGVAKSDAKKAKEVTQLVKDIDKALNEFRKNSKLKHSSKKAKIGALVLWTDASFKFPKEALASWEIELYLGRYSVHDLAYYTVYITKDLKVMLAEEAEEGPIVKEVKDIGATIEEMRKFFQESLDNCPDEDDEDSGGSY